MGYTTYEFYAKSYHGDTVAESSFTKYLDKATDKIDSITFDRLADGLPTEQRANTKVQKAVCSLIDVLFSVDARKSSLVDGKTVKSVSDGSESVSYELSLIDKALNDEAVRNKLFYDTVKEYLVGVQDNNGVNLLYAGV